MVGRGTWLEDVMKAVGWGGGGGGLSTITVEQLMAARIEASRLASEPCSKKSEERTNERNKFKIKLFSVK